MNDNHFTPKNSQKYICNNCHFKCSKKQDYTRHVSTLKHQKMINNNGTTTENTTQSTVLKKFECESCSKLFNDRPGLWRHNKRYHVDKQENNDDVWKNMFVEMVKQNEEFKKIITEQTTKMMEITQNVQQPVINTNSNNTINNTMNKFNLQIFLNETCKDAMNIQEFIDFCKVQHTDFENFGKYGYVESMTRIIMRNLMELEVHRRPIHCTDAKREVLYVKDNNVWVNDFSREKLIRAIKYIAAKNVKQIPGWMDHNPDSKNTQTKLHDKYMRMVCHSMGGRDEAEDQEYYKKIIRNVAKEVIIDKMK